MFNDKYKQYQKHKEETIKEHQKRAKQWHQPELPFYGNTKEEFYSHVSKKATPKALTDEEVNDLFWNHLVQVGWKFDTQPEYEDLFVLQCQKCEDRIWSVFISGIGIMFTVEELKNPTQWIKNHKCKAIPEEQAK
jgi:hypothetical protein